MSLKRLRAKQPELTHPNGISTYVNPLERSARLQTFISHRAMDFAHRLFLPRNLRRGFNIHHSDRALRCLPPHDTNSGIWRIEYHAGPQVLTPDMMDLEKWGWRCPLCEFHGNFGSKERVARHLDSDHGECGVEWAVGHAEGVSLIFYCSILSVESLWCFEVGVESEDHLREAGGRRECKGLGEFLVGDSCTRREMAH